MKTDSLFYRLFQLWPEVALELAGVAAPDVERYLFRSEEIKQTAFRLDGVLTPPESSHYPWIFVEVQFQPCDDFYRRLFAEIFLYLHRYPLPRPWRTVVIYPEAEIERIPVGYESLLDLPEVRRVYLPELRKQQRPTPGWRMLQLLISEPAETVQQARELLQNKTKVDGSVNQQDWTEFVETVLVYKLPRLRREEIQAMLGLQDIDFKETRFYQDVFAEGRTEGWAKGRAEGWAEGEAQMLRRQLTRRFGPLPEWANLRLQTADSAQLEAWADQVLEAKTLESVFTQGDDSQLDKTSC